jgi:large subunit ribosomal protein L34e
MRRKMVMGRHKSRTLRRIHVTTPGGRSVIHYEKRKPSPAKCAGCGATLMGVPRERPFKMRNIAKTKKRPERPYGGCLCSKCSRIAVLSKIR